MDPDPGGPKTSGSCRSGSGSPTQVKYIGFSIGAGNRRTDPYQIGKYSTVYWIKVFITVFRVFNTASRLVCFPCKLLAHCKHAKCSAGRFPDNIGARRVGLLGYGTHQKSGRPCHQVQNYYVSYKKKGWEEFVCGISLTMDNKIKCLKKDII